MRTTGFDKPLYILPFDHRGSFEAAVRDGVPEQKAGILTDEQFGSAGLRGIAAGRETAAARGPHDGLDLKRRGSGGGASSGGGSSVFWNQRKRA